MDTKAIISLVLSKLNLYSGEVQSNMRSIITHFNDASNLTEEEEKATQISFWRSIEDKSCAAMIERLIDDDYNELTSSYDRFPIFSHWNDCISWDEIFEYTNEEEDLQNELDVELEICYLQWFVKNWYQAEGHLAKRLEYFLIENNSVRNFDLKRFNFTDFYPNHKGPDKAQPYYANQLTDSEIRQRVLMDFMDSEYKEPLVRKLTKENSMLEFWYSNGELIIKDISNQPEVKILSAQKRKANENQYKIKRKYLSVIVQQIDELIAKGYKEI